MILHNLPLPHCDTLTSNGAKQSQTEISETVNQNTPSLLSLFLCGEICHREKNANMVP